MIMMYSSLERGCILFGNFFFFKQKTAYEMRISDWSSDVFSSDLNVLELFEGHLMRRFVNENFDAAERLHSHQMKDLGPNTITHVLALAINQWRKAISRKQIIADAHSSHGLALADLVPTNRAGYTCPMSSFQIGRAHV